MPDKARYQPRELSEVEELLNAMAVRKAEEMLPRVESELPPGTPLTLSIARAAEVFDTSERQLRKLIKVPGFPALKVGGSIKILTFKALKWLEDQQGERIELPEE